MKKTFFISTAIDYPSERGHLGHALEKIQADVLARYKRLQGFDVHFSGGLDEHGLKIQRYAQKAGKKPQEFVDEMSKCFKDLWKILNISNDDFIRTTEKRHKKVVLEIIKKINKKGDIYKGKYKGLYCVDCESYYLPKDLENGKCPIHKKPAEIIEEETYFFRMSKYQQQLAEHIKENKNFIIPESRRNEILSRLRNPLQDLSISRRTVEWGIPFPLDKKFSTFVWVEALMNYLTTIDYPNNKFKKFWPVNIHAIGKDIIWHHSVIWGSLLLSLGLPLPKTIFVHGFITVNGQKMSKSLGNIIDPFELVKKYGTDAVRYYLLREIPSTEDGDFTYEKFEARYNSDLAAGIGNLVSRVIAMAVKLNPKSQIPSPKQVQNLKLEKEIKRTKKEYKKHLENFKFNEVLKSIWELIGFCDKYINEERPWENKNQKSKTKNQKVICDLLFVLQNIADLLEPFLPETAEKIKKAVATQGAPQKSEILFPKILE